MITPKIYQYHSNETSPVTYAHNAYMSAQTTSVHASPTNYMHMYADQQHVGGDNKSAGGTSPDVQVKPPAEGKTEGFKYDSDKPDYSLLSFRALDEVVKTLTYGAKKYSRDNWKKIPDFHRRYLSAALRHITAHARGELLDPETGLHHLSHAIVSLMYLVEDSLEKGVNS